MGQQIIRNLNIRTGHRLRQKKMFHSRKIAELADVFR